MNFWRNLHPLLRRDKNNDYGSANYAVLSSLADSLSDAEQETIQNKSQLILKTASGLYLDEWGSWFGVTRKSKETDDDYRERIMWYLLVPRSTIEGIITGIKYYLDDNDANISVYEPWKNIFYTNKSSLNGPDHLQGLYYRFAVIDVRIDRPMSRAIYDAIMAFKPAGVKFYVTIDETLASDQDQLVLADVQSKNWFELEQLWGTEYNHDFLFTFADYDHSQSPKETTDYFKPNRSKLDGKDVLAGSSLHNLTYWSDLQLSQTEATSTQRNVISEQGDMYIILTPNQSGTLLRGNLSILNELVDNNHAALKAFAEGQTDYELAKAFLSGAMNVGGNLSLYLDFEGSGVTVNGKPALRGFNNLSMDSIKYDANDIYVPIALESTGIVKLHYLALVLNKKEQTILGLGAKLSVDINYEYI